MDNRFLIYSGFKGDSPVVFIRLIERFNFKILDSSDSGIHFINNRCQLDITGENGIQLWLSIPKYNISEMIPKLCMFKGDAIIAEYRGIILNQNTKEKFSNLSKFLCVNFSNELREAADIPSRH